MNAQNFLNGILNTLMIALLISGLSACTQENSLADNSKAEIEIIKETVDQNRQTEFPTPSVLHYPLQSNLTNQQCPIITGDTSYRLRPNDEVTIEVSGEDDLSNQYTVQSSGIVTIPLIGETPLSGCTLHQAEQVLFEKFTDGYLVNPNIIVSIAKKRPFYIVGEVHKPGQYNYIIDISVRQAVDLAGGFTQNADKKKVEILKRPENTKSVYTSALIEDKIHPGDIILIKERFF